MATADTATCPTCTTTGTLRVDLRMCANPLGTFSLAGAGMKVTARVRPVLTCTTPGCGFHLAGDLDPDGRHVTFPTPAR